MRKYANDRWFGKFQMTGTNEPLRSHAETISASFLPPASVDHWQEHYHHLFLGDQEEEKVGLDHCPSHSHNHSPRRSRIALDPLDPGINNEMASECRQAPLAIEFIVVGGGNII